MTVIIDHFTRTSMCEGKEAFSSPKLANRVAKMRQRRKRRASTAKVNHVYRCNVCNQFHLGTPMVRKAVSHQKRRALLAEPPPKRSLTELQSLDDLIEEGVFA